MKSLLRYFAAFMLHGVGIILELFARIIVLYFFWPVVAAKWGLPQLTIMEATAIIFLLSLLAVIAKGPMAGFWPAPPRRNPFSP